MDGRLGIGDRWTFNFLAGLADAPGISDGREIYSGVMEYLTPRWYFRAYHDRLGDNFNPEAGFIRYRGFEENSLRIERTFRPASRWLREVRSHLRRTWAHDLTGFKELEFRHWHSNLIFENGGRLAPAIQWVEEGLREPFRVRGTDIVVLCAGATRDGPPTATSIRTRPPRSRSTAAGTSGRF